MKELALKIFEGFSIQRWNDLVRPFDIIEMDKEGEMMVLAYIIGKFEENRGNSIDWEWMIYASLFDLLKKIALCDIKAPVQRMLKNEYPEEYMRLDEWVLNQYRQLIKDDDLFSRFTIYVGQKAGSIPLPESQKTTFRVYQAAHKFSTMRELSMIAPVNEAERLVQIQNELNSDIQQYLDLPGLQMLVTHQRPYSFIMVIEQLRFQARWNQTPRVPTTSVLGHCYFVAVMTLLLCRETGQKMCGRRLYDDFFSALFHDLPEAVTRDIISPVKQATDELPQIVKRIEDEIVRKELVPLMEPFYTDELMYFTSDEFEDRIRGKDGTVKHVTWEDLNKKYNTDEYSPTDGKSVRLADHLSALMEADVSIKHGITSSHLRDGRRNLLAAYPEGTLINSIDAHKLFSEILE